MIHPLSSEKEWVLKRKQKMTVQMVFSQVNLHFSYSVCMWAFSFSALLDFYYREWLPSFPKYPLRSIKTRGYKSGSSFGWQVHSQNSGRYLPAIQNKVKEGGDKLFVLIHTLGEWAFYWWVQSSPSFGIHKSLSWQDIASGKVRGPAPSPSTYLAYF